MNIIDIAIAKQLAGGGGGSGTDSYNDLSNLPKINDVTLSGNKSSSALGLQSEITSDSKLASDLVDDTNQDNKFVTSAEKTTWNGKQNAIDADHKINADYVDDSTSTNKFVTASDKETWNAKQNAIDNSHKLSSDLVDDTNHTNKFVTSTEKQTWNGKQNAIDADHKLSSSLVSFTTAEAAALASGIDSSKVGQISTNQTNILYNLNMGVKNKIPYKISPNAASDTGITVSLDADNIYKITGTKSISDAYVDLDNIDSSDLVGGGVASISVSGTGDCQIAVYGYDGTNYTLLLSTSTAQSFSVGSYIRFLVRMRFTGSLNSSYNATVKTMICTGDAWTQSHDWQPPALPNYDLTRLEAEDRASLAEVVDSGAKNLLDLSSFTGYSDGLLTMTKASDGTITVTGTVTGSFVGVNISTITLAPGTYVLTGCPAGGGSNTWQLDVNTGVYEDRGNGVVFTVTSTMSTVIRIRIATTSSSITKVFKPMLCTKAAFGVSQKFVPYRMSYQDLCDKKDAALSTTSKTSGSLDDIAENSFYFVSDGTTGRPVSEYGFVKTSVYSSSVMLQEFTSFSGNAANSGLVFVRVKQAGTWQSWKQLTNA